MSNKAKTIVVVAGLVAGLAACALASSVKAGTPMTPAEVQADLDSVNYYIKAAGCLTAQEAPAAAPVVTLAGNAEGLAVLTAVDVAGNLICNITLPPASLPAPPQPNAPAVPVVLPAVPAP